MSTILVSKEVVVSGTRGPSGGIASIHGGTWPFAVEAPGKQVTLRDLRFIQPKGGAIQVTAATGLAIAGRRIEGVEPLASADLANRRVGVGIGITTTPLPPNPVTFCNLSLCS